ncbi:hypothetical protein OIU85_014460 [Salix viminalis]|uniref:Uncharacterized protein n=1 Tax=Salix viminalis TaxID=40686 RepID=A0A9Q0NIQ7_SALVM|nr:hypothetical protein OIU85_014460 [Salix viminalis]
MFCSTLISWKPTDTFDLLSLTTSCDSHEEIPDSLSLSSPAKWSCYTPPHHNPNPNSHSLGFMVGPNRILSSRLLDIVEEGSNERACSTGFSIPLGPGKLPASQANAEAVSAFRREENEQTKKLIDYYPIICSRTRMRCLPDYISVHEGD